MTSVWDVLDIPQGSDRDTIRHAYARKLRVTQPEDDPEGFKRLREAYEAALAEHDFVLRWADAEEQEEGDDPAHEPASRWPESLGPELPAPDPLERESPEPDPRAPSVGAGEAEAAALFAAREAELTALRAAMQGLEAGLRGPWRPDDAALEARLNALLASPAMGEIQVRADVEQWLADLLAATIPYSDAVLLQSIRAFGWDRGDAYLRGTSWSISAVLERLDEWRIIEGLNDRSHTYHAAWQSLTRPPGPWWSWRIAAFRPNVVTGVETLLDDHGDVSPGLHHSFNAESVKRWKTFLARPRLTLGMVAMMPIVFLATLWLGHAVAGWNVVNDAWLIGGTAAIGFATPFVILFPLSRLRLHWREKEPHSRWLREGWFAGYVAIALVAMVLPRPSWPALAVLPALLVAAWAYVAVPRAPPGPLGLGAGTGIVAMAGFFSLSVLDQLAPAEAFAIGTMAALLVYVRIAAWPAARLIIEGLIWRSREWIILGSVVAGLAIAVRIWWLRLSWQPTVIFYPVALAAIALAPLVGAPHRLQGPQRWIATMLLMLSFLWALGASLPEADRSAPASGRSLVEADMARMEAEVPGFSLIRQGNPALFDAIRNVMRDYRNGTLTRDQANAAIADLVNATLRQRLPDTQTGLLVEWLGIRLERLKALRAAASAQCASSSAPLDDDEVPERIRQRAREQIYEIASSPPASPDEIKAGRPIADAVIARRTAAALQIPLKTLSENLDGKHGDIAACSARIAFTQALLDIDKDEDIAATLRSQLRSVRDAKPVPESARTGD